MIPKLEAAEYVTGHVLHLRFDDGLEGDVDLEDEMWGEVFEPLKEPEAFRRFELDRELNTVTWVTGADLAPEFLYAKVTAQQPGSSREPAAVR